MKKETKKTEDGKVIETVEHEDGRKSVKINVTSINVPVENEEDEKAKEVIETKLLPQLGVREVYVVMVHKPTNMHVAAKVSSMYVPAWIKACIERFPNPENAEKDVKDFMFIQIDGDSVFVGAVEL